MQSVTPGNTLQYVLDSQHGLEHGEECIYIVMSEDKIVPLVYIYSIPMLRNSNTHWCVVVTARAVEDVRTIWDKIICFITSYVN